ncbi:MAG: crossover junction endodeoxyribonuclease RuvC [Acidobacteriota bacterium]
MGLDPGSRVTGWGVVERCGARISRVASGCLRSPAGRERPILLASLAAGLETLLARWQPSVVAIETPYIGKFARAALGLAEARGAMLAVLGRWGGEVVEYEPARVKGAIVGFGGADKRQVAYVIRHELELEEEPAHDVADALAIALCHVRHSRLDV